VSDEEEFADVPPASDDDDTPGSPNPIVLNAGEAVS
jgi:hypothetical protein